MSRAEFRQVFPEELAAVDNFACSHVKQVHREHSIFVVVAEDVRIVAFHAGHALLLLQLLYRGDQVAILRGALVLLRGGGFFHALPQRADQVGLAAFQEKLHVAHRFLIGLGSSQTLHTGSETSPDVVLQAGPRVKAVQVHLAGRDQEVAMNQVDDAVGEVGREVRPVVVAAVFPQAAGHVDAGKAFPQR